MPAKAVPAEKPDFSSKAGKTANLIAVPLKGPATPSFHGAASGFRLESYMEEEARMCHHCHVALIAVTSTMPQTEVMASTSVSSASR
jgi:hypothetical protein